MKFIRYLVIASAIFAALPAQAQITAFKHIVIIVQENRTPDNLFLELCNPPASAPCNQISDNTHYDIKTTNWKNGQTDTVTPVPVDLKIGWDIEHQHNYDWVNMCDQSGTTCLMDGAANEICDSSGTLGCTTNADLPEFTYVQRYNGGLDVLGPYIDIALTYGWANKMFATNQGPSFPAHQFLYGGTSAPTTSDDDNGIYAAENATGCVAPAGSTVPLINKGVEIDPSTQYPCFTHLTLGTALFSSPTPWRYYTPYSAGQANLWTAPEAILSECGGSNQNGQYPNCLGAEFGTNSNVVPDPRQVLVDIQNCHLQSLSWVIPDGQYSDHAGTAGDLGPQWVAAIVNTIGASHCTDSGKTYWQDTAIIITWDDWGGWYDHEPPLLNTTQGYQLGFRVPLLVVSGYSVKNTGNYPNTCNPYIDGGDTLDFGSIANFIEGNFRGSSNEGLLNFADQRALERGQNGGGTQDLSDFFNLSQQACTFVPIPTEIGFGASYFISDQSPVLPPDDE